MSAAAPSVDVPSLLLVLQSGIHCLTVCAIQPFPVFAIFRKIRYFRVRIYFQFCRSAERLLVELFLELERSNLFFAII